MILKNLLQADLCTIARYDELNGPTGIQLFEFENSDSDYEQHMSQNIDNSDENSQLLNSQSPEISQNENLNSLDQNISNLSETQNVSKTSQNIAQKVSNSSKQKADTPFNPDQVYLHPILEKE